MPAAAFVVPAPARASVRTNDCSMGMFDGFSKAFENDSSLGARQNAGLKKDAAQRTITWVGPKGQKKQSQAIAGQKLRDIARSAGIPIRYDCGDGKCKTCEAQVGMGRAKIWCAVPGEKPPCGRS